MLAYKTIFRPLLFTLDPEVVHDAVAKLIWAYPAKSQISDSVLRSTVAGIDFENPVGMAAGFDKDCSVFQQIYRFGFGFVEVGTITPEPQEGNSKPRIDRLVSDSAIINRMGFPNSGLAPALKRLSRYNGMLGPLGVNIGANKESVDRIQDYITCLQGVAKFASYVTINVSSPNTPGLRSLESGGELKDLLGRLDQSIRSEDVPVFLKVSPDLDGVSIDETCRAVMESSVAGIIVGNTTTSRPDFLKSHNAKDLAGGLSGAPLRELSIRSLKAFYQRVGAHLPIISVGGISTSEDAYLRIRQGASLLQIYTAFIYEGPSLVPKINMGLAKLLKRDGFSSVADAVGVDAGDTENVSPLAESSINIDSAQPASLRAYA
ncbi:quinone-dependent dihydroorotate dehydrogenase [Parerythrobacter lacustris]|uniref:Dihydroorotate dehydrogenase (quinone) n=1 Tax=Parerythrobacter lacustris TaxID=2969984 RepID=A0ABT1XM48_9SPHN|nr:quinone-dependent dihydroorotate dehydrogenase [Parerythrobacter lacustris]MCR2832319.1 quinone-dependent dihydroorotate dehydrogenase [Parerythrobacter lacustris]